MLGIHTPALPASLRRTNERTLISLLFRLGSASRADLAKAAGISQPTAGKIITELLKLGVVQVLPENAHTVAKQPKLGRPGERVCLASDRPRFIAIEVGVTETHVTALPMAFLAEDRWTFSFPTPAKPAALQQSLRALQLPRRGIRGVLVSAPGLVAEPDRKVIYSPNLHWTEGLDWAGLLAPTWPVPVLLIQEIRALALGHLAADPQMEDFLLVDFGQGIGGAVVSGGKLMASSLPCCGELGHTLVPGSDRPCGCGAVGCLETMVSERGLLQSFQAECGADATWSEFSEFIQREGLVPWLKHSLEQAAWVIAGALNVLGIRNVVLTGSLNTLPDVVMKFLQKEITRGALWARFGQVTCQGAPRRRAAGLAAAAFDRLLLPSHSARPEPSPLRRLH